MAYDTNSYVTNEKLYRGTHRYARNQIADKSGEMVIDENVDGHRVPEPLQPDVIRPTEATFGLEAVYDEPVNRPSSSYIVVSNAEKTNQVKREPYIQIISSATRYGRWPYYCKYSF